MQWKLALFEHDNKQESDNIQENTRQKIIRNY